MAALPKLLPAAILLTTLSARADSRLGVTFDDATALASRKLENPACLAVLSDFRDAAGRPLAERLLGTGLTAREYFESLDFRNGAHEDTCQRSGIDAFTNVGRRSVFVCGDGCFGHRRRDVSRGSNVLIHEMLHTLGLGEDLPSSLEITSRVAGRCGR
jgi:hypothetical protein